VKLKLPVRWASLIYDSDDDRLPLSLSLTVHVPLAAARSSRPQPEVRSSLLLKWCEPAARYGGRVPFKIVTVTVHDSDSDSESRSTSVN
jgi:hypothetical protein